MHQYHYFFLKQVNNVSLFCLVVRNRTCPRRGWTQVIYQPVLLLFSTSQYNIIPPEAYKKSTAQILTQCSRAVHGVAVLYFLVGRKPISIVFLYHLSPCSCRSLLKMNNKSTHSSVAVVLDVALLHLLFGW